MDKVKVIVVDDSAAIRTLFSQMLTSDRAIEVVATAEDPFDARNKIKQFNPDVITLDVEMPKMDGISFLEKIMSLRPMPVVMASSLTTRGADITIRALEIGAVDYIAKPSIDQMGDFSSFREELLRKVKHAANVRPAMRSRQRTAPDVLEFTGGNTSQLIAIGSSTGGVEAIHEILVKMPANCPPIVITQHMPEVFTASFARRMDSLSAMRVHEAAHGMKIVPGHVYIAAGGYHLEVRQQGSLLTCALNDSPPVSGHRPSVDVLFQSVARIQSKKIVAAILTGMGHDGAKGLYSLRETGAHTLGQSEASCVVYGMPRAAKQLGAVEREIPLSDMSQTLLQLCSTS